jgi:hypothetical protein
MEDPAQTVMHDRSREASGRHTMSRMQMPLEAQPRLEAVTARLSVEARAVLVLRPVTGVLSPAVVIVASVAGMLSRLVIAPTVAGVFSRLVIVPTVAGVFSRLVIVPTVTGVFSRLVIVSAVTGVFSRLIGVMPGVAIVAIVTRGS